MQVRPARADDLEHLVACNAALARETEDRALDDSRLRRGVSALLADRIRGEYFLATEGARVDGCLLVTREWSDWRAGWFWWIQSVYVVPEARRKGVYRALHEDVLRRARAAGDVCGVRLYVDRDNRAAQSVYQRLGMTPTSYSVFETDFVLETRG